MVKHDSNRPITAHFIRFVPVEWNYKPCMRVEVYGTAIGKRQTLPTHPTPDSLEKTWFTFCYEDTKDVHEIKSHWLHWKWWRVRIKFFWGGVISQTMAFYYLSLISKFFKRSYAFIDVIHKWRPIYVNRPFSRLREPFRLSFSLAN